MKQMSGRTREKLEGAREVLLALLRDKEVYDELVGLDVREITNRRSRLRRMSKTVFGMKFRMKSITKLWRKWKKRRMILAISRMQSWIIRRQWWNCSIRYRTYCV